MRPRIVWLLEDSGMGFLGLLVPNYVVMLVVGTLLASWWATAHAERHGIRRADSLLVLALAYLAGLAGAFAFPLIQACSSSLFEGAPLRIRSGMAAYGGLLAGTGIGLLVLRWKKMDRLLFLDVTAPAIGLGIFAARIGCFLAGCDYGKPTDLPWAVHFPRGSHAYEAHVQAGLITSSDVTSLGVHPTQLYHGLCGLLLFLVLVRFGERLRIGSGLVFFVFAAGYACLRFAVEFFRGDENRGFVGALSASQFVSVLVVVVCIVWAIRRRPAEDMRGQRA
jgi:phosphatidylglycerol:prolipoprotein diacylglycerol transferase